MRSVRDRLDRLTERIKHRLPLAGFPSDDDNFLVALGVNPDDYASEDGLDGATGYNFIAALNDTARSDWDV